MTPQQGKKFIFISYAHKDSRVVLPLIHGLMARNFNVWYDDSIEAGSEWPEYIATNLLASECVIVFMSSNADASHNCRQELTYAIDKRKKMIVVYLEDFQPSPGTEMQLHNLHALYRSNYAINDDMLDVLSKEPKLRPCLSSTSPSTASKSDTKTEAVPATATKAGTASKNSSPAITERTDSIRDTTASLPLHDNQKKVTRFLFLLITIAYLSYSYLTGRTIFLFYSSRFWYIFLRCLSDSWVGYLIIHILKVYTPKIHKYHLRFLTTTHLFCLLLCPIISVIVGGFFLNPAEGYWFNLVSSCLISLFPFFASFLGYWADD